MKWFFCFVSCLLCLTVFCQDEVALTKTDSLKRDNELRLFLKELHIASISRDTVKLLPLIAENVQVEPMWMDGVYAEGKKQFVNFWNLKSVKDTSVLWQLLSDISEMDGMYSNAGRWDSYLLPRYDPGFRQNSWLVMKDSLAVYSEPDTTSEIVRWLPKGTAVVDSKYYHYKIPAWIRFRRFDSYSDIQQTDTWIQTSTLYVYGWHVILIYKKDKWLLSGVSGFEYLYPVRE